MRRIEVSTSPPYAVEIGAGIMPETGAIAARTIAPCAVTVVSDDTVAALYAETVEASFERAGFDVRDRIVFPHGEASKDIRTFGMVTEGLAARGMTRSDIVAAVGGGVTGDLAGFSAACYCRGISFVQVPTTLLAMTDSSVGGKTAVDLAGGKNMCGAFHQPSAVVIDTDSLATLPRETLLDGSGEVAKYAAGFDASLFGAIREWSAETAEDAVARCVEIKAEIVAEDERDIGVRQKLNLGHTVAHAMERLSSYTVSHGRAVASGVVVMTRASEARGMISTDDAETICGAIEGTDIPVPIAGTPRELAEAAMSDKKRRGGSITVVLPTALGRCELVKIASDELEGLFESGMRGCGLWTR